MGFTFKGNLPQGFVLSKPMKQGQYDESEIYALEEADRLIITRKRDGWKVFVATDGKFRHRFFTDGPREIKDGRLGAWAEALRGGVVDDRELLVGEAHFDKDGADELGLVQSFFAQKDPAKALEIGAANGGIRFAPFGGLYQHGRRSHMSFCMAIDLLAKRCRQLGSPLIQPPEVLEMSFDDAKKTVVEKGWEGLVLYDTRFRYEFRLDGKDPKRPSGCWKWKPVNEDDFIVRDRIFRDDGALKELVLSQIGPDGSEFYCGKLGAFDAKTRTTVASLPTPFVVQAEYDERYKKTGKLRVPRFVRVRDDKRVEECTVATSYPEAEAV